LGTKTCSYPFLDGELIFEARYTDAPDEGSGSGSGSGTFGFGFGFGGG